MRVSAERGLGGAAPEKTPSLFMNPIGYHYAWAVPLHLVLIWLMLS